MTAFLSRVNLFKVTPNPDRLGFRGFHSSVTYNVGKGAEERFGGPGGSYFGGRSGLVYDTESQAVLLTPDEKEAFFRNSDATEQVIHPLQKCTLMNWPQGSL